MWSWKSLLSTTARHLPWPRSTIRGCGWRDKLAAQLTAATEAGASWVYAGDVTVDENLHILGGGPPLAPQQVVALLSRYNSVPGSASSVMVAAELLAAAGGFDTTRVFAED